MCAELEHLKIETRLTSETQRFSVLTLMVEKDILNVEISLFCPRCSRMPVGATNSCPILALKPQMKFVPQEILRTVLFQIRDSVSEILFETLRTKIFSFFTKSLVCGSEDLVKATSSL